MRVGIYADGLICRKTYAAVVCASPCLAANGAKARRTQDRRIKEHGLIGNASRVINLLACKREN